MDEATFAYWIGFVVGMAYQLSGIPAWQARQIERGWAAWQARRRAREQGQYDLIDVSRHLL